MMRLFIPKRSLNGKPVIPSPGSLITAAVFAVGLFGLFGQSRPAQAGFQVEQKVSYGTGGKTAAQFNWQIGPREFRLDVKRGSAVRSFVFNGRVFYVCGRLDKSQLNYVNSLNLSDKKFLASLGKGTCQELSTDFGLKFFLSPFDAVVNVEVSGALGSSLSLAPPTTQLTGVAATEGGTKCVEFTRSYKLVDRSGKAAETISETACSAPSVKWRQGFSRELGMTLMRQAGGRQCFQALSSDLKKMVGLSLTAHGKTSGRTANGKDYSRSYEVSTSTVTEATPTPAQLAMPEGFEVLDTDNLTTMANHARRDKTDAGTSAASGGGLEVVDVFRALIMGVTPAFFVP